MHDRSLIHATSDQVDQDGDESDDAKDAAGSKLLLGGFYTAAGDAGAGFEDVGAAVGGCDKGDGHLRGKCVVCAQEGDDCIFATGG